MLYPTHKRYGEAYAFLSLPLFIHFGWVPGLNMADMDVSTVGDLVFIVAYVFVAYRASLFGAEYPDIDSPGSKPAQKHYLLKKIFQLMRVKHRGKYSHDFGSLLITFGLVYLTVHYLLGGWMSSVLEGGVGNSDLTPVVVALEQGGFLNNLLKTYVVFSLVGAYSHLLADATTKSGVWILWSVNMKFVPVFITKWKVGSFQPFKGAFKTGTAWEDFNRKLMTFWLVVGVIFLVAYLGNQEVLTDIVDLVRE